jgi:hypothetical protein
MKVELRANGFCLAPSMCIVEKRMDTERPEGIASNAERRIWLEIPAHL